MRIATYCLPLAPLRLPVHTYCKFNLCLSLLYVCELPKFCKQATQFTAVHYSTQGWKPDVQLDAIQRVGACRSTTRTLLRPAVQCVNTKVVGSLLLDHVLLFLTPSTLAVLYTHYARRRVAISTIPNYSEFPPYTLTKDIIRYRFNLICPQISTLFITLHSNVTLYFVIIHSPIQLCSLKMMHPNFMQ